MSFSAIDSIKLMARRQSTSIFIPMLDLIDWFSSVIDVEPMENNFSLFALHSFLFLLHFQAICKILDAYARQICIFARNAWPNAQMFSEFGHSERFLMSIVCKLKTALSCTQLANNFHAHRVAEKRVCPLPHLQCILLRTPHCCLSQSLFCLVHLNSMW